MQAEKGISAYIYPVFARFLEIPSALTLYLRWKACGKVMIIPWWRWYLHGKRYWEVRGDKG
jgi:hypothetical protein